jgi:hypothetical protein
MQNQLETLRAILKTDVEWFEIQIKASTEVKDIKKASYYEVKKDYANSILNQLNEIAK